MSVLTRAEGTFQAFSEGNPPWICLRRRPQWYLSPLTMYTRIAGSVKITHEGEAVLVELFDRYQRTFAPGLDFTLPIVDTIVIDTTREHLFGVLPQDAVTMDGVPLKADAVMLWEIKDLL